MASSYLKSAFSRSVSKERGMFCAASGAYQDMTQLTGLATAIVTASMDGLYTPAKADSERHNLPSTPAPLWTVIDGGNHAQFGWYGVQSGDNTASISSQAQASQYITAALALLQQVNTSS